MNSCGAAPTSIRLSPTNTPMPWSTWTTRSPTLRSRKSERNVLVADRRRSCVLRSSSKTSVSAQNWRPASGSLNPRDRWPYADEHRCGPDVLGFLDRRGEDLVVREQLDRALGEPGGVRDEDDRVAGLSPVSDLGCPLRARGRRTAARADTRCVSPSSSARVSRAVAPSSHLDGVIPRDDQLCRRSAPGCPSPRPRRSSRESAASASRRVPRRPPARKRAPSACRSTTGSRTPSPIDRSSPASPSSS